MAFVHDANKLSPKIWDVLFLLENNTKIKAQVDRQAYCLLVWAAINSGSTWCSGRMITKAPVVVDAESPPPFHDTKHPFLAIHRITYGMRFP